VGEITKDGFVWDVGGREDAERKTIGLSEPYGKIDYTVD
jgi:hypothetical protein